MRVCVFVCLCVCTPACMGEYVKALKAPRPESVSTEEALEDPELSPRDLQQTAGETAAANMKGIGGG